MSGTPSAVVVELPKLEVMSGRTTPSCASTSGPLVPSPGNGPAVSSGIVVQSPAADEFVTLVVSGDPVVVSGVEVLSSSPEPHPTRTTSAPPPSRARARRRLNVSRPRSSGMRLNKPGLAEHRLGVG